MRLEGFHATPILKDEDLTELVNIDEVIKLNREEKIES